MHKHEDLSTKTSPPGSSVLFRYIFEDDVSVADNGLHSLKPDSFSSSSVDERDLMVVNTKLPTYDEAPNQYKNRLRTYNEEKPEDKKRSQAEMNVWISKWNGVATITVMKVRECSKLINPNQDMDVKRTPPPSQHCDIVARKLNDGLLRFNELNKKQRKRMKNKLSEEANLVYYKGQAIQDGKVVSVNP